MAVDISNTAIPLEFKLDWLTDNGSQLHIRLLLDHYRKSNTCSIDIISSSVVFC